MFETVYRGKKYEEARNAGIEQIAKNFVGLVQLKNYSTFKNLLREIFILIKLRPLISFRTEILVFQFGVFHHASVYVKIPC